MYTYQVRGNETQMAYVTSISFQPETLIKIEALKESECISSIAGVIRRAVDELYRLREEGQTNDNVS